MKSLVRVMVVALLAAALATVAPAQDDRESRLRTVRGTVIDNDDGPIPGGVVFLKNVKTGSVRTSIAGDDGTYRFSGLDPNVDFEIHAEHKEQTSAKRTVSSFQPNREIVIHLKVNKKK